MLVELGLMRVDALLFIERLRREFRRTGEVAAGGGGLLMMSALDFDFMDDTFLRALTAAGVVTVLTDLRVFEPLRLPLDPLEASLSGSATTTKRGLLTPMELTFFTGSESFFVLEGGLGGRAVVKDLMLVSLLLPPRDVPLPFRVAAGDFLADLMLEEGDREVSFAAATVRLALGLGLPLTARWNTGENSGEVVSEGESGRPDCVTTSTPDCREVGSKTELDLKAATALSPSPSPPLLL